MNPTANEARAGAPAAYRLLLRLLPARVRYECGADMEMLFAAHLREATSRPARVVLWAAAILDVLRHAPALWRTAGRGGFGRRRPPRRPLRAALRALARDARYALRFLRRQPGTTAAVVLLLALAIGANTAIFSFVDALLLRPLPFPDPDRLQVVTRVWQGGQVGFAQDGTIWERVRDLRAPEFDVTVYSDWITGVNLAAGGRALSVRQQRVGAGFFHVLGVGPALGREFSPSEDVPGGPALVILSDGLWRRLFDGDPAVLGRTLLLRGEPHTIVGVMPPGFRSSARADLWVPLRPSTSGEGQGTNYTVLVRLRPGVSPARAAARLAPLGYTEPDPDTGAPPFRLALAPLQRVEGESVRRPLQILWATVAAVLLLASVNVSGLLLARGRRRVRELATRMALGGDAAAIGRQLALEAAILAVAGGLVGLAVAGLMMRGLGAVGGDLFDVWRPVRLDLRVLGLAAACSLLAALVAGTLPALQVRRVNLRDALASGGRTVAGGSRRALRALLVLEIAGCCVLLVLAGLLLRTFLTLQRLEPGFDPRNVVAVSVSLHDARYESTEAIDTLFHESLERIRALPVTESAAVGLGLPYRRLLNLGFAPVDFDLGGRDFATTNMVYVTPGYFETLRIPLLRGRAPSESDAAGAPPVVVVNRAFEQRYLPQGAIDHELSMAGARRRIVGVVGDVEQSGSFGTTAPIGTVPTVYVPVAQLNAGALRLIHTWFTPSFLVRTRGPVGAAMGVIQRALSSVDPLLPPAAVESLEAVRAGAMARQRFLSLLLGGLALTALLLAVVGVWGLVAGTVAEQQRSLAVRLALGARPADAVLAAAVPSLWLAAMGCLVGLAGAAGAAGAVRSLLFGVGPVDPLTYAGVVAVLAAAAATAALLPALRAARIDPARTLAAE